jgi:hypothetical protein
MSSARPNEDKGLASCSNPQTQVVEEIVLPSDNSSAFGALVPSPVLRVASPFPIFPLPPLPLESNETRATESLRRYEIFRAEQMRQEIEFLKSEGWFLSSPTAIRGSTESLLSPKLRSHPTPFLQEIEFPEWKEWVSPPSESLPGAEPGSLITPGAQDLSFAAQAFPWLSSFNGIIQDSAEFLEGNSISDRIGRHPETTHTPALPDALAISNQDLSREHQVDQRGHFICRPAHRRYTKLPFPLFMARL